MSSDLKKIDFKKQWGRLVDNLELGRMQPRALDARQDEAWKVFEPYPQERFADTVSACIVDTERRYFPTVGELMGYFEESAPPTSKTDSFTEKLLADPGALEQLQKENEDWWRDELMPRIEACLQPPNKKDSDGKT